MSSREGVRSRGMFPRENFETFWKRFQRLALFSIQQTDLTSFSEDVLNGYVTNPNPTPTLTPNPNRNSNFNRINEKIQKETTLENR